MLVHEKDVSWRMCFDFQAFNNFLIHEEVRFNMWQRAEQYVEQANRRRKFIEFEVREFV